MAEERTSELEDISIETSKAEKADKHKKENKAKKEGEYLRTVKQLHKV